MRNDDFDRRMAEAFVLTLNMKQRQNGIFRSK